MAISEKLKQIREDRGFIPDEDLYDFAESVVSEILEALTTEGHPLTPDQIRIVNDFIE